MLTIALPGGVGVLGVERVVAETIKQNNII